MIYNYQKYLKREIIMKGIKNILKLNYEDIDILVICSINYC